MTAPDNGSERSHRFQAAGLLVLAAAGAVGVILYAGAAGGIGIRGEWVWQTLESPRFASLALPLALTGVFFLGFAWLYVRWPARARLQESAAVLAVAALLFLLQIAFAGLGMAGHVDSLFASYPPANAYLDRAARIESVSAYLAGYRQEVLEQRFRVQLSTHPPGSVLFYLPFIRWSERFPGAANTVSGLFRRVPSVRDACEVPEIRVALERRMLRPEHEAAAWLAGLALRLLAALVVVPVYLLCRLELPPKTALAGSVLASAVPALFLFSPHPDQLFPLLAGVFLWLAALALRRFSCAAAGAAGIVLLAGFFFSLSFAAPAFVSLLVWAIALVRKPCRQHFRILLAGVAGAILPAIILFLAFEHDVLGVWKACAAMNDEFNRHSGRTYWKWLLFNPLELAVFCGVPLFVLFWHSWLQDANRRWLYGRLPPWRQPERQDVASALPGQEPPHPPSSEAPAVGLPDLILALGVTFLLLNLTGKNLGEVGRLWMIVMPVMALAAGTTWETWKGKKEGFVLLFLALQLTQVLALRLLMDAMGAISLG
jgi:hypothetical protein